MTQKQDYAVMDNQTTDEQNQSQEIEFLQIDVKKNSYIYFVLLFLIGTINNIGYVIVGACAQIIANKYIYEQYVGAFTFCLIVMSAVIRAINSKFLIHISHKKRILMALALSGIGYAVLTFSIIQTERHYFFLCLLGTLLVGISCAFGEAVMLGYLNFFPHDLINNWSSGTGLAGIGGDGILLALRFFDTPLWVIFISLIPLQIVYFLSFQWMQTRLNLQHLQNGIENTKTQFNIAQANLELTWNNIKKIYHKSAYLCLNLGIIYYLEYVITVSFADHANQEEQSDNFWNKNAFIIVSYCYQLGVFISRSSLKLIKIKRISILSSFQLFNTGLWALFAFIQPISIYFQVPTMIFVGFMGGAAYVNVYYLILENQSISKSTKEMITNVSCIHNDIGILLATITALIISYLNIF